MSKGYAFFIAKNKIVGYGFFMQDKYENKMQGRYSRETFEKLLSLSPLQIMLLAPEIEKIKNRENTIEVKEDDGKVVQS